MSIHDRFNPEQEWQQQGQIPQQKPVAKTEAQYYAPEAKTSEQEWTKSFHATTTAGAMKLNMTRYQDGTLQGTYKLQGRQEKPLTGKVLLDKKQGQADVYLKDENGAKWHGRFMGDQGDRLLFGNVLIPGIMGLSGTMQLGDVVFGAVETPIEEASSETASEVTLEPTPVYRPPQVKNPPPPAVKNPPPPAVKGPQPTTVTTAPARVQQPVQAPATPAPQSSSQAPKYKPGEPWTHDFTAKNGESNFSFHLERQQDGTVAGTYSVNGGKTWGLKGGLETNGMLVLKGTENEARFTGLVTTKGGMSIEGNFRNKTFNAKLHLKIENSSQGRLTEEKLQEKYKSDDFKPDSNSKIDRKATFYRIIELATDMGASHPEIIAAQWALESTWGRSPSGKNNLFGIKSTTGKGTSVSTQEGVAGEMTSETAIFKDYENFIDSMRERIAMTSVPGYKLYKPDYLSANTPRKALQALQSGKFHYAQDYVEKNDPKTYVDKICDVLIGMGINPDKPYTSLNTKNQEDKNSSNAVQEQSSVDQSSSVSANSQNSQMWDFEGKLAGGILRISLQKQGEILKGDFSTSAGRGSIQGKMDPKSRAVQLVATYETGRFDNAKRIIEGVLESAIPKNETDQDHNGKSDQSGKWIPLQIRGVWKGGTENYDFIAGKSSMPSNLQNGSGEIYEAAKEGLSGSTEKSGGYCQRWVKQVLLTTSHGQEFMQHHARSARLSGESFKSSPYWHSYDASKLQPGDIVYWLTGSGGYYYPSPGKKVWDIFGHVGIYMGDGKVASNNLIDWSASKNTDARGIRSLTSLQAGDGEPPEGFVRFGVKD
jgi:Mannosyl-glycoprotein endo-beta-N-acetylglucosaminidase